MNRSDLPTQATTRVSAFTGVGLKAAVAARVEQICALYLEDDTPWIIGYSGGKDSTAVLQLIWLALRQLPADQRTKIVHVISTDTLVENPVVAAWVESSLDTMRTAAQNQGLPIAPHRLTPAIKDRFWVNLIGKGYPAPRPKFRWCTSRLKIAPSNSFIKGLVRECGEAILVLGTRKQESAVRARVMAHYESKRQRDLLSPNGNLPGCLVFTPVEDWSNDDVWTFLMQVKNPWGYSNKDLLTMYQGASADGECPLVVDGSTPSCGDSRFGCWVCTMVEQDKSMSAMIQNDTEKGWMEPLLAFRNELDLNDDDHLRDFRRMNGTVQLFHDSLIRGPYTQQAREQWLRRLLEVQRWVRENGPPEVRSISLITMEELREIRRIWVVDKHEIEDRLPKVWQEVTGEEWPDGTFDDDQRFGPAELDLLRTTCADKLRFETVRELLDVERQHRTQARRAGLFGAIAKILQKGAFADEEAAKKSARTRQDLAEAARSGNVQQMLDLSNSRTRAP